MHVAYATEYIDDHSVGLVPLDRLVQATAIGRRIQDIVIVFSQST